MTGYRPLWLLACFLIPFSAVLFGVYHTMNAVGLQYPAIHLDVMGHVRPRLAKLGRLSARSDLYRIAFLGDSTAMTKPARRALPARLQQITSRLAQGEPPIQLISLAYPGMGPLDYYFLADEIARARPDQIIVSFNLAVVGQTWRRRFMRPELAGWIQPGRVPEATGLPLHQSGLTLDRLFFYVGIVQAGGFEPWRLLRNEQVRVGRARQNMERALGDWISGEPGQSPEQEQVRELTSHRLSRMEDQHLQRLGARRRYGAALTGLGADHLALQVLGAALRVFRQAGISTLVFILPIDVERLDEIGVLDEEGLARTSATIDRAVRENGGEFADFRRLIGHEGFSDILGHFAIEGGIDTPKLLAEALGPLVVRRAKEAAAY